LIHLSGWKKSRPFLFAGLLLKESNNHYGLARIGRFFFISRLAGEIELVVCITLFLLCHLHTVRIELVNRLVIHFGFLVSL
jgi:hypothetical protein